MNKIIVLFLVFSTTIFSQVKIGNTPSVINQNSILELESTNKAFVLTRLTTFQMNAITPLKGAIVYNVDENCLFMFNAIQWKSLCNSYSGVNVTTSISEPANSTVGDFWINNVSGVEQVNLWNGSNWVLINQSNFNGVNIPNNGITKVGNKIQLGGVLIKPTVISTNATNTLAIDGLQNETNLNKVEALVVEKNTGILKKTTIKSLMQEEVTEIMAIDGQSQFNPLILISDSKKVNVFRNGVRIDFTVINNTTIEVEPEAVCYAGDQIKIVQFY